MFLLPAPSTGPLAPTPAAPRPRPRPAGELVIQRPVAPDGTARKPLRMDVLLDTSAVIGSPTGYTSPAAAFDAAWILSKPEHVRALAVVQTRDGMFVLRRAKLDGGGMLHLDELLTGPGRHDVRLRLSNPTVLAIVDAPAYVSRF